MKIGAIVVTILIFALVAVPVLAQETGLPAELPDTAAEALQLFAALVVAPFTGLMVTTLIAAIRKAKFLNKEDQELIAGASADFLTAVLSVAIGSGLGYLGYLAGFLDKSGIWQLATFTWPAAKAWYEQYKQRKLQELAV